MQQGLTLYLSIVIMAILLALVLGLTAISVTQLKMTRGIENSVIAFYAADTGVERVLAIIYDAVKNDTEGSSLSSSYSSASDEFDEPDTSYNVDLVCCSSSDPKCNFYGNIWESCPLGAEYEDLTCSAVRYCIRSKGTYKGTKRAVEATYGGQGPTLFASYTSGFDADDASLLFVGDAYRAQTFTMGAVGYRPIFARLRLSLDVLPSGETAEVNIRRVDADGYPIYDAIAIFCDGIIELDSIEVGIFNWYPLSLGGANCLLDPGTMYAIVLEPPTGGVWADEMPWSVSSGNPYAGGSTVICNRVWTDGVISFNCSTRDDYDYRFEVWGYPI